MASYDHVLDLPILDYTHYTCCYKMLSIPFAAPLATPFFLPILVTQKDRKVVISQFLTSFSDFSRIWPVSIFVGP